MCSTGIAGPQVQLLPEGLTVGPAENYNIAPTLDTLFEIYCCFYVVFLHPDSAENTLDDKPLDSSVVIGSFKTMFKAKFFSLLHAGCVMFLKTYWLAPFPHGQNMCKMPITTLTVVSPIFP